MDVSIIIVNYKTSNLVADCLESVINFTKDILYEVIIVDNNSEQDFKEKIISKAKGAERENFHYIALSENIGFGRANNEGFNIAKGRNIFFLNPDTILLNNAIKILSDFLDSHPEAGACGGNLVDANLNPSISYKRYFPGFFWEFDELLNTIPQKILYGQNIMFNHFEKPLKVAYISGADLMVRKYVLEKTGCFSPEFFMFYEETDLCSRIKKAGYDIYSVPEAQIIHLVSQSMKDDFEVQSEFKTKHLEESRNIYYRRNVGKLKRFIVNIIYDAFLTSRGILLRNPKKKIYYRQRKTYFKRSK